MRKLRTVNPATERVIAEYDVTTTHQLRAAVERAHAAFEEWRKVDISNRTKVLRNLSGLLKKRKRKYAELVTTEMGKPIRQAVSEVEKCAWVCDYYADNAEKFLAPEMVETEYKKSYVTFEPLGVVAGIMPWNFPFWQVVRFAAPAIAAGNVIVFKHSSVVVGTSLALRDLFQDASDDNGIFQTVIGPGQLGEQLVQSEINAVSVTGSIGTGARVAEIAGGSLRKFVLELGGSDPFIVLEDADIDFTCENAITGRMLNNGQSCIAPKRFIVMKEVADEFTDRLVERTEALTVGDPMDEKTRVGPLVRDEQRKLLAQQVKDSLAVGAKLLTGGKQPSRKGFFYLPTVLTDVTMNMRVAKEETFGPVSPIIVARNQEEAIQIANDSEYGLGASIWTNNRENAEGMTRELRCGLTFVNKLVRSDPRLPFGGVKKSGIGRELSRYGLLEFTNIKSVVIM